MLVVAESLVDVCLTVGTQRSWAGSTSTPSHKTIVSRDLSRDPAQTDREHATTVCRAGQSNAPISHRLDGNPWHALARLATTLPPCPHGLLSRFPAARCGHAGGLRGHADFQSLVAASCFVRVVRRTTDDKFSQRPFDHAPSIPPTSILSQGMIPPRRNAHRLARPSFRSLPRSF